MVAHAFLRLDELAFEEFDQDLACASVKRVAAQLDNAAARHSRNRMDSALPHTGWVAPPYPG
jgi:hypothetical protein